MALWIELPVAEIAVRYIAGESTPALGRAYGVNHNTVWRRLVAAGVEMRPAGGQLGHGNTNKHKLGGPLHGDGQGYLVTFDREGKQCYAHRACWEAYHGPIPEGYIVHHINGDPADNRVENLACMSNGQHSRLHGLLRRSERAGT